MKLPVLYEVQIFHILLKLTLYANTWHSPVDVFVLFQISEETNICRSDDKNDEKGKIHKFSRLGAE